MYEPEVFSDDFSSEHGPVEEKWRGPPWDLLLFAIPAVVALINLFQ